MFDHAFLRNIICLLIAIIAITGCINYNSESVFVNCETINISFNNDTVICECDVTHDGVSDELLVALNNIQNDNQALVELSVVCDGYTLPWNAELGLSHMGWCSYYILDIDGKTYLVRYCPSEGQGICDYVIEVFFIDENGHEIEYESKHICNEAMISGKESQEDWERQLREFEDLSDRYISESTLIISTLDGELIYYGS